VIAAAGLCKLEYSERSFKLQPRPTAPRAWSLEPGSGIRVRGWLGDHTPSAKALGGEGGSAAAGEETLRVVYFVCP
jgi:hypothetical protein